jgi:hypothetical protein
MPTRNNEQSMSRADVVQNMLTGTASSLLNSPKRSQAGLINGKPFSVSNSIRPSSR